MPFSDIITRSFDVVWRNRSLWIVGMILAFFGGGSSGSNFNFSQGSSSTSSTNGDMPMPDLPAWFTMENIILFAGVVIVIYLVLGIIALVIQSIVLAGLIRGTDAAIEARPLSWREMLRSGWQGRWQSLFWLKILVGLPALLVTIVGAIIGVTVALPFMQAVFNEDEAFFRGINEGTFFAGFFGMFCLIFCIILIVAVVQWVLSLVGYYASRGIVLEGKSLKSAWGQGWQLFRATMLHSIVMSIILALLLGIIGLVISIPIILLFAVLALPMFAIIQNINTISPVLLVSGGILFGLGVTVITSVLWGPLVAYRETVWTMTYHHITGRELPSAPSTPTPTPTPA